ncbi:MAG TPA: serine/threonine-protein kinase [Phycisphaerales bacterium]|nr:serine/threonine-protein kinase [Phycisphaerales bacterium]HMP37246.1 serine/threonine-protein kinase [Phycisphaerales bacterium]
MAEHPDDDGRDRELFAAALRDVEGLRGRRPLPEIPAPPGYELRRLVRRGGQGTVYEGIHLATRRRVALKRLHEEGPHDPADAEGGPGRAGAPGDRLRAERELMLVAEIEHPGVVAVRDCADAGGRRWHVMDFVEGTTLDRFLLERRPDLEETLALFASIAEAVAAAHLRGVIHRDLKPGNVIVDESGLPRVLDFGLAKRVSGTGAADGSPAAETLTETGRFLGSVAWASPEQAEGRNRDIDLRTDVYALGVMLHHALAGEFPYRVDGSLRETLGRIVNDEPTPLRRVRRGVDSDTETIVLKALQKDPERRYQSGGELARDLRRRLAGEAIAARADSTAYVLGKMLRRHRGPVAATAAFVALLLTASATLAILYREAQVQTRIAAEAADVLDGGLLAAADPHLGRGPDARIVDLVDEVAQRLDGAGPAPEPRLEATLRRTVGAAYRALTRLDEAERHLERSVALFERVRGPHAPETLRSLADLAALRSAQGRFDEAVALLDETIERAQRAGIDDRSVLRLRADRASALERLGRFEEAERTHRGVLAAVEAASPPDPDAVADARTRLATLLCEAQRHGEALPLQRAALHHWEETRGQEHLGTAMMRHHLATTLVTLGEFDEAKAELERSLATQRSRLGETHADTLASEALLAILLLHRGDRAAAAQALRAVHGRSAGALGGDHNETLHAAYWLAMALTEIGEVDEAERLALEVHHARRSLPPGNPHRTEATRLVGRLRAVRGDLAGWLELQRELLDGLSAQGGAQPLAELRVRRVMAMALARLDRLPDSTAVHEEVLGAIADLRPNAEQTSDEIAQLLDEIAREARPIAHRAEDRAAAARMALIVADAIGPPPSRGGAGLDPEGVGRDGPSVRSPDSAFGAAAGARARRPPISAPLPPPLANRAAEWRLAAVDDFIALGAFDDAAALLDRVDRDRALLDNPDLLSEWRRQRDRLRSAPFDRELRRLRDELRRGEVGPAATSSESP